MSVVTCPGCGCPGANSEPLDRHRYRESGLDVWLHGGVTRTACPKCGETFVRIEREGQLLQVIAVGLLTKPAALTGPEMRFLRRACELTQRELARRQRIRRETVAERENRKTPTMRLPDRVFFRLIMLHAFQEYLAEGADLLADSHKAALTSFANSFVDRVNQDLRVGQFDLSGVTVEVEMDSKSEEWRIPLAA